jgi:endonuclease/exonuclease/phosphatase (EEP) superfamily protein YafD
LNRVFGACVLLALVPSWLGLLGGWHWLLDLFSHFRWQYLFLSGTAIVLAAWRRQYIVTAVAALTFLLNVLLIGRLAWHPDNSVAPDGAFALNVMSINVRRSNLDTQRVIDQVMASDADVVFLMEIDHRWLAALEQLKARYPHHIAEPRPDNFGIALFSRNRWEHADLVRFGTADIPSVQASIAHQGRRLFLIGTHPAPPVSAGHAASRDTQLRQLAGHVSRLDAPALVVGDLNSTPWSVGMRMATTGTPGLRAGKSPWAPTWRVGSPFAIPIDHALATAPLVITRRSVGPDVGSDHRPLAVVVGWED